MWDVAPPGASIELAQWSTEHYQRHGRPLRLAIDAHYWRHHFENHPKVKWLRKSLLPHALKYLNLANLGC